MRGSGLPQGKQQARASVEPSEGLGDRDRDRDRPTGFFLHSAGWAIGKEQDGNSYLTHRQGPLWREMGPM